MVFYRRWIRGLPHMTMPFILLVDQDSETGFLAARLMDCPANVLYYLGLAFGGFVAEIS